MNLSTLFKIIHLCTNRKAIFLYDIVLAINCDLAYTSISHRALCTALKAYNGGLTRIINMVNGDFEELCTVKDYFMKPSMLSALTTSVSVRRILTHDTHLVAETAGDAYHRRYHLPALSASSSDHEPVLCLCYRHQVS